MSEREREETQREEREERKVPRSEIRSSERDNCHSDSRRKKRLLVSPFKFLPVFDSSAREGVIVCLVVRAALGGEGDDDVWPIYMQMLLSIVYCYGRFAALCKTVCI